MKNKNTQFSALDEQFKANCEIVNLRYEYPGYTGTENFGIITHLTEDELRKMYAGVIEQYEPFILLPPGMTAIRRAYKRNEDKFYKRSIRGHLFSIDDEFEEHHPELVASDEKEKELHEALKEALQQLPEIQARRIRLYYFEGYQKLQIATMEGVAEAVVGRSIAKGIKNMKNFLEGGLVLTSPSRNK